MSNSKVKLVVEFAVKNEMLKEKGLSVEDVVEGIRFHEHDAIDGFEITTNIPGCDCASDFFLCAGTVVNKEIIKDEQDMGIMRFPYTNNTRDWELIRSNLNAQGLQIIEDVLAAYNNDKIDIEVVLNENNQIDFDKSGSLVVKDKNYVETGFESLVIKWVEDMEDTGYLIECFDEYSRDKRFENAAKVVSEVCSRPDGKELFGIANIVYMLKECEDFVSQEEILKFTERIYEASFMTDVPLLTAERVDAIRTLLENGITEKRLPDLPSASPEQVKELLLTCDMDIFIDLVETVAVDNQAFYSPEYSEPLEERLQPVKEAILAMVKQKAGLDEQIGDADAKKVIPLAGKTTKDLER